MPTPIEELKANVENLFQTPAIGLSIFVVLKPVNNSAHTIKRINLENEYQNSVCQQFIDILNHQIIQNENVNVIKISEYEEQKNTLYEFDLQNKPLYVSEIINFDPFSSEVQNFNFAQSEINQIYGFIITIGTSNSYLKIYQHKFPTNILSRKNKFFIIKDNEHFKLIDKDILSIDSRIDLLIINDKVYVQNFKMLERNFGFHEIIQSEAVNSINTKIAPLGMLESVVKLETLANSKTNFARRMLRVVSKSPVISMNIQLSTIRMFLDNNPHYGKLNLTEDASKIKITTHKEAEFFLDILEDNFLESKLTQLHYAANRKNLVNNEEHN